MSKYINADELVEKYLEEENDYPTDDYFEGYIDGIIFCHRMVDQMPSADVVEVKHGEWLDKGSLSCRCSNCGCKSSKESKFCPYCGADMWGKTR